MTTFHMVKLKSITVNMKSGEIHISAMVALNDENFAKAETLRPYLDAEIGGVTVEIQPQQMRLETKKEKGESDGSQK